MCALDKKHDKSGINIPVTIQELTKPIFVPSNRGRTIIMY